MVPYRYYIQSPLGLVPKAGGQTRLIFHLSYDFREENDRKSLNCHTPEELCTVKYKDLDHVVRTCLDLIASMQDNDLQNIYFAKSDLTSAFRILPIIPWQQRFLLMKAKNPNTGKEMFFVDKCLPFGSSISCAKFQLFSDALHHIIEYFTRKKFRITNFLDNYLFIAMTEQECNNMVSQFLDIFQRIGCPVALDKTEYAMTKIVFLGILMDGEQFCLCVPTDKKNNAVDLLKWLIDQRSITIKTVQRVTGILNFLNKAIVPGRAFTRTMYNKLKTKTKDGILLKQYHHVSINADFKNDSKMWLRFLTEKSWESRLCRPFVDFSDDKNSVVLNFYSDASAKCDLGMGAIFNRNWIVKRWDHDFITKYNPSIEFLELFALVAVVLTWQHNPVLNNSRVEVFCDNESVKFMVNDSKSHCCNCMKLIRILTLNNLKHNRKLIVRRVSSKDNILADAIS